jgi:hypothetical protein
MRLTPIRRSARRRVAVDAMVAAYSDWRRECAAVRNAYRSWASARAVDKSLAFVAYNAALDREERAAKLYARLLRRTGHVAETGLAHQLAQIQITSGAR